MYLGCDGKDEGTVPDSIDTRAGGEEVSEVFEGTSDKSGGESLRFLWGDVMKVTALFPCGNKALRQKYGLLTREEVSKYLNFKINICVNRCCRSGFNSLSSVN